MQDNKDLQKQLKQLEEQFTFENDKMIAKNQPLISELIRKIQALKKKMILTI